MRAIDGQAIGPQAGSCGTAAYRREPVIVEDIATDPLWEPYRETALAHGLRACWSTPIFDGRQGVLGTFALYYGTPRSPTSRHLYLIDVTTYTAAIAIAHHREREEGRRREVQFAEAERVAHLGSYEWDAHTNQTRRSTELCRIFGLTPSTFPPTFEAYLERVHPDDRDATRQVIEASFSTPAPFAFEERIVRPDGSVRQLRSQGAWIGNETDRTMRLVGVCQDVTDRRQADEEFRRNEILRVRNQELKAFAYMVSHDLKAPLRGIAGYARELAHDHEAALNPRGVHCVEEIVAAARSLDALIEDLLRCSRRLGAWDYVAKQGDYVAALPALLRHTVVESARGGVRERVAHRPARRVLYIERHRADVDLTITHFKSHAPHLTIEAVGSSREALDRLGRAGVDVVLTDLRLPDMNALDLLRQLRHRDVMVPAVIVTGRGDEAAALAALKLGAYDYIVKREDYLV